MEKNLITRFLIIIFLLNIAFTQKVRADGFWYNVWDEIKFEATRSRRPSVEMNKFPNVENKIYRIGSNYVYYNSLNPDKIERIGNKSVEYKMTNDEILKIGNDYVIYSANGKILRVGNNEVLYNGDRITRIGNDEVFYK